LRIAQVAPLFVRVPPVRYGGTERVISALTEELVRRGHEVTLFAAGTSKTEAWLLPSSAKPLWDVDSDRAIAYQISQADQVLKRCDSFDVVHWHSGFLHWLIPSRLRAPSLTTLHCRLDGEPIGRLFMDHPREPVVSISNAQRRPVASLGARWIATVHNGLDLEATYQLGTGDGGYLAFVGRSSPEKGLATAIRVAIRCRIPIKIAARVEQADSAYYRREVVPLLDHPLVDWLGEATEPEKATLLAGARALLMPVDWDEPFGLAFVEALAAGTPVVTRPLGALPEIMRDGEHALFALSEDELVEACNRIGQIDRAECRRWALTRFTTKRMTDDYEVAYERILRPAFGAGDATGVASSGITSV
jgi:glycosyltransferase involved in cell wall biosynthesis